MSENTEYASILDQIESTSVNTTYTTIFKEAFLSVLWFNSANSKLIWALTKVKTKTDDLIPDSNQTNTEWLVSWEISNVWKNHASSANNSQFDKVA
jgi:hypothetical protein